MNNIYLETLSLLSASLHDNSNHIVTSDNSHAVFEELQAHAVTSLVAKNIANMHLSNDYKLAFMKIFAMSFKNYNNIVLEQQKILNLLRNEGIDVVVLKGTSAARYYPYPEYRTMGDIDILVKPEDFERAECVLISLGLTTKPQSESFERHIGFFTSSGMEIELHRYFSSVGYDYQRKYLDNRLYEGITSSVDYTLNEVDNGLVLIGHVAQHLKSGLGLRQIIDWMMYAEYNLSDEFWNEEFGDPVNKCGFSELAKVTTAVCRKYLGLSKDITWCDEVDEKLIDTFMEYIMNHGNFGRKQKREELDTAVVLNNFRNPIVLFKYLQAGGKCHWKLARTNKFVGCFAWIYQIVHIIKKGIVKKVSIKNIKQINTKSKDTIWLMNALDIHEY